MSDGEMDGLRDTGDMSDVSYSKDKSIMKTQLVEGRCDERPKERDRVKLKVFGAADAEGRGLPGFAAASLEFTAGDGEVCDALEFAAVEMKPGERALITVSAASRRCAEPKLGLDEVKAETVRFTLELVEFEKAKDTWDMFEDEKLQHGEARKAVAGNLFRAQRIELALKSYSGVVSLLDETDFEAVNKGKADVLKRTCELNRAACLLKTGDWLSARTSCDIVLQCEAHNVKALFRRATANRQLRDYLDAMKDCNLILEQDPANVDARRLLPNLQQLQKAQDSKSKGTFSKMCKGLGELNTPEPHVAEPYAPPGWHWEKSEGDPGVAAADKEDFLEHLRNTNPVEGVAPVPAA